LIQKEPKHQVTGKAFLPHRPLPCKTGRISGCNILPYFVHTFPSLSAKNYYALPNTQGRLILPVFIQSCAADRPAHYFNKSSSFGEGFRVRLFPTDKQLRQKSGRTMMDRVVEGHCSYCKSMGLSGQTGQ
jgi:hypothetical protein